MSISLILHMLQKLHFKKIIEELKNILQTFSINLKDKGGQPRAMALTWFVKKKMHKLDFCLKYPEPFFVPN